jgi:hypothetical protein
MNIPRQPPLNQMRKKCLECDGGQYLQVRIDHLTDSPLWHWRFGKRPQTVIKEEGPAAAELFDPKNFQDGQKFGLEKEIESIETEKAKESSQVPPILQKLPFPDGSFADIGDGKGNPTGSGQE